MTTGVAKVVESIVIFKKREKNKNYISGLCFYLIEDVRLFFFFFFFFFLVSLPFPVCIVH